MISFENYTFYLKAIDTAGNSWNLIYRNGNSSPTLNGSNYYIYLGAVTDGIWHTIKRNLASDLLKGTGATLDHIASIMVSGNLSMDNLAFYPSYGVPGEEIDEHRFTGKELDEETGLVYFGARYYDSEVGRFTTVDPAEDGENWYAYCRDNPIKNIDPTGLATFIDSYGKVMYVSHDENLSVYQIDKKGMVNKIGETYFSDTFSIGNHINVGVDKIKEIMNFAIDAAQRSPFDIMQKERNGGKYDVKNQWDCKYTDGFLLLGKYCTAEDIGNYLAGLNAAIIGTPFETFQRMSGALHQHAGLKGVGEAYFGKEYGPAPTYGEVMAQYRMSILGYNEGFDYFTTHEFDGPALKF